MNVQLTINGEERSLSCEPGELLLHTLRRAGCWGVKHGCETGECGACAVLIGPPGEGRLLNSCTSLTAQVDGATITTIEGLSPDEGGERGAVDPIQQAFIDTGAIQCGYCTPAQILAAKALLDQNPDPSEAEVREALAGVLCRCTGYVKPVEAVLEAAAVLRGEVLEEPGIPAPPELFPTAGDLPEPPREFPEAFLPPDTRQKTRIYPPMVVLAPPASETRVVNKPEPKVDGVKLAKGRPVFTDDMTLPGMLYGALLTSPHAHARIQEIHTDEARALPGVHAVLTYRDVPRVVYASGGQSYPNPLPYDQVSLDNKVRHVGDRVAIVAAETPEIAQKALDLIQVDYEVLPAVFDPEEAMTGKNAEGEPVVIHDEPDAVGVHDAEHNIVHDLHVSHGDIEAGYAEADHIFEHEYRVHQVQQVHIEPHVCITWWDEDDRLVVRTSTQTPFHTRRMLAPLIDLPIRRIRVIKPRIGGGFGGKQEMMIEDLCAHLTIATGRPVRMEYSREQSFTSARSRHPQILRYKTGVKKDGSLTAIRLHIIADKGAYGSHGLTVQFVAGFRGLSTYLAPHMQFDCQVVYTNKPAPGAYRGYGAPQALFALESHMEEIALALDMDPVAFKRQNWIKEGDEITMAKAMGEGREGFQQFVRSSGLEQCVQQGAAAIHWERRLDPMWRLDPSGRPHIRRGLGFAVGMHGSGIAGLDMGAAAIKLNDDGSFNLTVGATDLGTGSDTILAQIAAETLGVPLEEMIIYSSDTDLTPFDTGAYASSTTYISGNAVLKAAEQVRQQIIDHAARHLFVDAAPERMFLEDRCVWTHDGRSVTLAEVALHSLHQAEQHQIMATASHMSYESPPPFSAQYAEVEVDMETGQVEVKRLVIAVDCGTAINPITASGQVEGGLIQALGYSLCEEMAYDEKGRLLTTDLRSYKIFAADEVPELGVILVQTYEPSGPYGAKAIAEIPKDAVAPAVASAIQHATGVRLRSLPFTPERVWRALRGAGAGEEGVTA
jgi:putative selenate reductase molybdopterin-binding subunit